MKTDELTGSALDYWVARAEEIEPTVDTQMKFCPSSSWADAGPIIEREHIMISWNRDHWIATVTAFFEGDAGRVVKGPTALVAAMRAYVLSKLGETVDD